MMEKKMKKILYVLPLALCACQTIDYQTYFGEDMNIKGTGGYQMDYIEIKKVRQSLPEYISGKRNKYKYDSVVFFRSGLPQDEKCRLIGRVAGDDLEDIAEKTLEMGANTATMSLVSFDSKFDDNKGSLISYGDAGIRNVITMTTSYIKTTTTYSFNVFECI